jgi:cytochrome c-type biogenesis protein CcsB
MAAIDRLFAFSASLRLAVITILALAFVLAAATFYEASYGTDAVQLMVYQSGWFAGLLGVLALNVFAAAAIRFPWKRHQAGFVITHAGILVLLFGCVWGFHRSIDGVVAVRQGSGASYVRLKREHFVLRWADERRRGEVRVPVSLTTAGVYPSLWRFVASPVLGAFGAPTWPSGEALDLQVPAEFGEALGRPVRLQVTDWYPAAEAEDRIRPAEPGEAAAGPAVRVVIAGAPPAPGMSRGGASDPTAVLADLWLHHRGAAAPAHQGPSIGAEQRVGPMVLRLLVLGDQAEVDRFEAYDAEAELPAGAMGLIEIAHTWDGRLAGRRFSRRGLEWSGPLELGQPREAFMAMTFQVSEHLSLAVAERTYRRVNLPPDKPGVPAARLRLAIGEETHDLWLLRDGLPRTIGLGAPDEAMNLTYGLDHLPLGFSLVLDHFERGIDPGTDNPASFASQVRVIDPEQGVDRTQRIWMNHPLSHRGLKVYQSGFQELPGGEVVSVFAVNKDPGRPIKYAGSLLIVLGIFTMFYMRAYFVRPRKPQAIDSPVGNTEASPGDQPGRPLSGSSKPGRVPAGAALALLAAVLVGAPVRAESAAGPRLEPDTLDALRALPVMHDGRVKPLDTVARQTIRQITGHAYFGVPVETNGELEVAQKMDPVELMLALMSDPEGWAQVPMIQVELLELRDWLGMPRSHTHIAAMSLIEHPQFHPQAQELFARSAEAELQGTRFAPSRLEQAIMDVARREGHFRAACHGALLGLFPYPNDEGFFQWLADQDAKGGPNPVARAALMHDRELPGRLSESQRRAAFVERAGWMPLGALLNTDPAELPPSVRQRWTAAGALWANALRQYAAGGPADAAVLELARRLPEYTGAVAPTDRIHLEVFYNALHPFRWAVVLFLLAAVVFAVATQVPAARWVYAAGVATLMAAVMVHVYGFFLRVRISGWAPVTNMYETIVWVALVCAVLGLILELVYRWKAIGLAAAIVAAVCGLIADIIPPNLGAEIRNLQPVLRSNFWLSTHVTTIVSSYAAFALALGLGNLALGIYLFAPGRKEALRRLGLFIYRALQVGVLLVAAGTILGGVWADQSWGRFWGWDPKEVWALIVLLVYLALLHARYAGWVGQFGLAAGAVLGFQTVIMAWYGVNFVLGVGLHSYGFGTGGRWQVFTYVVAQCAFVAAARWRCRRLLGPEAGTAAAEGVPPQVPPANAVDAATV